MQNSALSFSVCFDYHPHKVEQLIHSLENDYMIKYNEEVILATIRHYAEDSLNKILNHRKILVEQKNRTTLQVVLKNKNNS
jgi:aspartate kinase